MSEPQASAGPWQMLVGVYTSLNDGGTALDAALKPLGWSTVSLLQVASLVTSGDVMTPQLETPHEAAAVLDQHGISVSERTKLLQGWAVVRLWSPFSL